MAHILIGAGIGATASLATGGDPVKGALLGGVTGGALGGTEGGLLEGATSAVNASTPTMGGLALEGATTGAVGGATAGGVAGATASPYAFGSNALEVAGSTMPLTATGTASVDPTMFDKATNLITPSGGYVENPTLLDKIGKNTGFSDMTPIEKVQTGLFASEAFTPQEQAQQIMQGGGGGVNPGKPVNVSQTGTGMLNVNVPTGIMEDIRKRQLFAQN